MWEVLVWEVLMGFVADKRRLVWRGFVVAKRWGVDVFCGKAMRMMGGLCMSVEIGRVEECGGNRRVRRM